MEGGNNRGGEEEDMEIPNNNYNNNNNSNNINHHPLVKMRRLLESTQVMKLPLAPIISTPRVRPDHRIIRSGENPVATVSTRRGSSIFSPTQTLDHHQMNNSITSSLPPPPPPQIVQKEPTPDPDPNPITAPAPAPADTNIIYKECLKNHAANIGGHVVDGCGEFMPSGDEGTPEALRCNACHCHRSFHRKQDNPQHNYYAANNQHQHQYAAGQLCRSSPSSSQQNQNHYINFKKAVESSSEDLMDSVNKKKKRFRTKFSKEQKERMSDFAEKLEWRMQKKDEDEIQQFCNEVGVKREVFKVFMHNCKQANKKIRQTSHH